MSVFCAGEWNIKKKKGWRHECVVFCEGCKELKKKCELKKKGGVSMFCAGERNIEKKKGEGVSVLCFVQGAWN